MLTVYSTNSYKTSNTLICPWGSINYRNIYFFRNIISGVKIFTIYFNFCIVFYKKNDIMK